MTMTVATTGSGPRGIVLVAGSSGGGNIIWAEHDSCRVQIFDLSNSTTSTMAGAAGCGYADGPVSSAKFGTLNGILLGGDSNIPSKSSSWEAAVTNPQ